ncbi:Peroxiredoxin-4-like, partial [Scleropages formosus]
SRAEPSPGARTDTCAAREARRMAGRHKSVSAQVFLAIFTVAVLLQVAIALQEDGPNGRKEQECYKYAGGHVYPGEAFRVPGSDHSLHLSKAKISKPAPRWEGTAVINGEFKELKLTDYRGRYLVFFFYPLDFTFVCPTEIIAFSDRIQEFRNINAEVVACSVDSQGLFIIDDKGVLRQITMNDLPVGRSVDETLRLVQAFQYTDKHGEVCPAGWKPGSDTIIPDPSGKLKYFDKLN